MAALVTPARAHPFAVLGPGRAHPFRTDVGRAHPFTTLGPARAHPFHTDVGRAHPFAVLGYGRAHPFATIPDFAAANISFGYGAGCQTVTLTVPGIFTGDTPVLTVTRYRGGATMAVSSVVIAWGVLTALFAPPADGVYTLSITGNNAAGQPLVGPDGQPVVVRLPISCHGGLCLRKRQNAAMEARRAHIGRKHKDDDLLRILALVGDARQCCATGRYADADALLEKAQLDCTDCGCC